jgi:hypothetical protein
MLEYFLKFQLLLRKSFLRLNASSVYETGIASKYKLNLYCDPDDNYGYKL